MIKLADFYNLPEPIQDILLDPDNMNKIEAIAKNFNLSEKQIDDSYSLICDVLTGLLPPNQFITKLSEKTGLPLEVVKQLAYKISENFFFPVREEIKKLYQA